MPETSTGPQACTDKERDAHLEEWKKARDTLQFFDDKLHDLRKYGFSFLTALLTAGTFLTQTITSKPSESLSVETKMPIPGIFNLGVFVITLGLIVALHLLDKNYRVFLGAAYTRAAVLERKLNLELSETIAVRHGLNKINQHVWYVYIIFIVGVALLGIFILYPNRFLMLILAGLALAAGLFMYFQDRELRVRFKNPGLLEDWIVSPLECMKDEDIRITLNNLNEKPDSTIIFPGGRSIFEIKDEHGKIVYTKRTDEDLIVYGNHAWIVKLTEFDDHGKKGVYRLQPRGWKTPLPISIIVHE